MWLRLFRFPDVVDVHDMFIVFLVDDDMQGSWERTYFASIELFD